MQAVKFQIIRFVDADQPGWVECELFDAHGEKWTFIEKIPVVTTEDLWEDTDYPRSGFMACKVIETRIDADGRKTVTVDTELPFGIESTAGTYRFTVLPEQVEDWDTGGPGPNISRPLNID